MNRVHYKKITKALKHGDIVAIFWEDAKGGSGWEGRKAVLKECRLKHTVVTAGFYFDHDDDQITCILSAGVVKKDDTTDCWISIPRAMIEKIQVLVKSFIPSLQKEWNTDD